MIGISAKQHTGADSRVCMTSCSVRNFLALRSQERTFATRTFTTSLYAPTRNSRVSSIPISALYAVAGDFRVALCLFATLSQVGPPVKCQRICDTVPGVCGDVCVDMERLYRRFSKPRARWVGRTDLPLTGGNRHNENISLRSMLPQRKKHRYRGRVFDAENAAERKRKLNVDMRPAGHDTSYQLSDFREPL